jgi:hypothetical protein
MAFSLFDSKGTPVENQRYTWRDMVRKPLSKLDDDAFTRVRVIMMNGIEVEALRFSHMAARFNKELRLPLALIRRSEQHQATMINWLLSADHSPLEITIAYEQVAIELTAAVAQREPDPYLAQTYRYGLLEDFDHIYRLCSTGLKERTPTILRKAIPILFRHGRHSCTTAIRPTTWSTIMTAPRRICSANCMR